MTAEELQALVTGRQPQAQAQPYGAVPSIREIMRSAPAAPRDTSLTGVMGASPIARGQSLRQAQSVPLTKDPQRPVADLAASAASAFPGGSTADNAAQRIPQPTPMVPFVQGPGQKDRVPPVDQRTAAELDRAAKVSGFFESMMPSAAPEQTAAPRGFRGGTGKVYEGPTIGDLFTLPTAEPKGGVNARRFGQGQTQVATAPTPEQAQAPAQAPLPGNQTTKADRVAADAYFKSNAPEKAQDNQILSSVMQMTNRELASAMGMLPDAPEVKSMKEVAGQQLLSDAISQVQEASAGENVDAQDAADANYIRVLEMLIGTDAAKNILAQIMGAGLQNG